MTRPLIPLLERDILVPDLYERNASLDPNSLFATSFDDGLEDSPIISITWAKIVSDARKAAAHLVQQGCTPRAPGEPLRTVAIFATSGYAFYVYQVAAFFIGWTVLLVSTRNSDAGIAHLLDASKASHVITDERCLARMEAQKPSNPSLKVIEMRDIGVGEELPPRKALSEEELQVGLSETLVYFHTSGSTGHPKLVPCTHGYLLAVSRTLKDTALSGVTVLTPLPQFHGMGFYGTSVWPFALGTRPVFIQNTKPLTGSRLLAQLRRMEDPKTLIFISPATLEEVSEIPGGPQELAHLTARVLWGGAPMRQAAGTILAKYGVQLVNMYGSSEVGHLTSFEVASENLEQDWNYTRFLANWNLMFKPIETNSELCELIIMPGEHITPLQFNCLDPKGFSTMDLFKRHEIIPDLWKHQGRNDSVTVLSNGEKTFNKQLENLLLEDSRISKVVVFGAGRFLNGVIISPAQHYTTGSEFVDAIWPTINHTNSIVPRHSRLLRELILVESPENPFVLSDKGTVRAVETISRYADEIETAYSKVAEGGTIVETSLPEVITRDTLAVYLKSVLETFNIRLPMDDSDFFEHGLDSLLAIKLYAAVISALHKAGRSHKEFPRNAVYTYSTIPSLVDFALSEQDDSRSNSRSKDARIQTLIDRHTKDFRTAKPTSVNLPEQGRMVVLLTGATGSLGCHILWSLLQSQAVSMVYCLVRPSSSGAESKLRKQFETFNIDTSLLETKSKHYALLDCDLSRPDLGVEPEAFAQLRSQVTHVIHNAWLLNFNIALEGFEKTHIAGVGHLVNFCFTTQRPSIPHLTLISSIGAVQNYRGSPTIPEIPFVDTVVVDDIGYSQSKYVAERIIDAAAKHGLPSAIIRGGQISGSTTNGYWNEHEFVPILFKTSFAIGAVPLSFPDARWMPVDIAGEIVANLAIHSQSGLNAVPNYYHVENPIAIPWKTIVDIAIESSQGTVRAVHIDDWAKLVTEAAATRSADEIPAVKLLDFLKGFGSGNLVQPPLDVKNTKAVESRVEYGVLSSHLIQQYLSHFRS